MLEQLSSLTDADRQRLIAVATLLNFAPEQTIIVQGDAPAGIFLLQSGTARVEVDYRGGRVPIASMSPGEWFGELSFFEHRAASASVVAEDSIVALLLPCARLNALLEEDSGFAARFYRSATVLLAERLRVRTATPVMPFDGG